ncbi:uncharacterized protein TNCV_3359481 [Trichonephila clavipes]|nr:uncharacterized protein TNCV_3359481 [Trichonephila clavipes]
MKDIEENLEDREGELESRHDRKHSRRISKPGEFISTNAQTRAKSLHSELRERANLSPDVLYNCGNYHLMREDSGFRYPHDRAGVGRYLSHCSCKAVANSWFLCKQDAISNKIPLKIKMDRLKFKLEIVEALSASSPTNNSILIDDEDNSVVIPLAKRSKRYNPPAIHVMAFILTIPG